MSAASQVVAPLCCGSPASSENHVWWRLAISAFLSVNSMTIALAVNLSEVDRTDRLILQGIPLCVCVIVAVLLGGPLLTNFVRSSMARRLTIETLFLLSIAGAFFASLLSYVTGKGPVFFEVVSILCVVYAFGRELGRYSQKKVLDALIDRNSSGLMCEVLEGSGSRIVAIAQIQPGDLVRIHPGAMVPIDGRVREGSSFVREESMTGESFAASRRAGDRVLAGTHVVDSTLIVEAEVGGSERCVDRISQALHAAALTPGDSQVAVNRIMQWFVPLVAATALATFLIHSWRLGVAAGLFNAMAVLLVACPCALGFATPIAVWTAMLRLRSLGMTVRSGAAIERLAAVNCVAFDKTGTLTLTDSAPELELEPDWRDRRVLVEELISAAESNLKHPIAQALRPLVTSTAWTASSVRILPGKGILAVVHSHQVRITAHAEGAERAEHRLMVEVDGHKAATILLRETQRPLVAETIRELAQMDIGSILVTGDSPLRAAQLPLRESFCRLTPEQKIAVVRRRKQEGQRILFVGDGINDAAAMAESDVAIALGSEPLARAAADIEWPAPVLSALPKAISHSRATVRLIRSNLLIAMSYNLAGIGIAAAGFLHPVVAALLMTASSTIVTFRAMQPLEQETL
jgi:heavy metal translocating P-type ATPase